MLETIKEKSELGKKYFELTGLTYDIADIIEAVKDADADTRMKTYLHLAWHIKQGVILTQSGNAKLVIDVLTKIASELNLDLSAEDVDGDGDVDAYDEKLNSDAYFLEMLKPFAEQETKDDFGSMD